MKKFTLPTLICVLSLSFFSCSKDNSEIVSENQLTNYQLKALNTTDLATAKQLYIDMMATQEYANFKNSIKNFNDRLGVANQVSFETKAEWMDWIRSNILITAFTIISEFETFYDDSISKLDTMIAANSTLYNFMDKADSAEIGQIITPEFNDTIPGGYPVTTNSCVDGCIDWCDSALDLIDNILQDSIALAETATIYSVQLEATMNAYAAHANQYLSIGKQFNQCVGAC